jgi:xanthine phosphoribosyltransferase
MQNKTFEEVLELFGKITFAEKFDLIVAIANGGIIPAAILNQRLDIEIQLLKVRLRNNLQIPMYESPKLVEPVGFEYEGRSILVVEDRVKTGASLKFACKLLQGAKLIRTFAVNGEADYSLYNEDCFKFPWLL